MRYDLSDYEWSVIEPVLPKGRPGPREKTTDGSSMPSSGFYELERHGAICRSATGLIRPPTIASIDGARRGSGTA